MTRSEQAYAARLPATKIFRSFRFLLVACALVLMMPASGKAAAPNWRDVDPKEMIGAWEYSKSPQWLKPFWYLVIREDGHLGWIYSKEQLPNPTRTSLIEMIDKEAAADGKRSGWETYSLTPGRIVVAKTKNHVEEYFVVWIGVADENKDRIVIGEAYNLPPVPPGGPLPTVQPLQLQEIHRLPD